MQRKEADVSEGDRREIKTYILTLMLKAESLLQKQLSDALAMIRYAMRWDWLVALTPPIAMQTFLRSGPSFFR